MGIENPVHLIFIAVVALIVLGPRRLPELARRLGDGVRELREAMDVRAEGEEHPPPPPTLEGAPAESTAPADPEPGADPELAAEPEPAAEAEPERSEAVETSAKLQAHASPEQAPKG
jgi:TatA/E family protein of Tat protein translocase